MSRVIKSKDNEKLKTVRKLGSKRWRAHTGLFAVEGEDLIDAAERAGVAAEFVLAAGEDVAPELLAAVSSLGSGTRVVGVYRQRWSPPGGELSAYLHGVGDPGNVGTIIRAAHALADGPVVLGPGCADPYSVKALRASMGSIFARPPARCEFRELRGQRVALDAAPGPSIAELRVDFPLVVCVGAERRGLPGGLIEAAECRARIPMQPDGPESLNAATAASIALYEFANRMAAHA